ncbi:retrovirus-related pol polyprotein from transposon TNT 1-94 [Tanacetum coccineum]
MLKMVPKTPLQFGVAKRLSRTFRAESTGIHVEDPKMLWADSVGMVYLIYPIPYIPIGLRIPEEEWQGKDTSLAHLKSPGVSSDMSERSKNSRSFEDSGRSDEEYSKDEASSKEGGKKASQSLLMFMVKEEHNGSKRYKARLMVKGFQQKRGVDYNEIFSPVVKMTTIRFGFGTVLCIRLRSPGLRRVWRSWDQCRLCVETGIEICIRVWNRSALMRS